MDPKLASSYLNNFGLSPEQLEQLRDLLERGMGVDAQVAHFREVADQASAHHKALLSDSQSPSDIRQNAERLFRAARVDQAKSATQLDALFRDAGERGLSKPFEDIRTLSELAKRDTLAAKELLEVYRALDLPVPVGISSKSASEFVTGDRGDVGLENGIELDDREQRRDDAIERPTTVRNQATAEIDESELGNEVAGDSVVQGLDRRRNPRAVPDHIATAFHRKGDKFLDPKDPSTLIFLDKGDSLKTARDFDNRAIRAMIDVAAERGWHSVKVTGTPEFRRVAWFEAASRGMEVRGYNPTEAEMESATRAAKAAGAENSLQLQREKEVATKPVASAPRAAQRAATSETELDPGQATAAATERRDGARAPGSQPTGRLIEHGAAPFEFNEDNKPSYYVKVATQGGEKTYWGVDFPRALEEGGAQIGQQVTIRNTGKRAVTIEEPVRDETGEVIGRRPVETNRNTWEVAPYENQQLQAFKQAQSPEQKAAAAKAIPNLKNAFAFEAALQKFAETRLQPGDVDQFMQLQREMIQRDLADGVAFPDVHVREVAKTRKATRDRVAEHGHEH